MYTSGVSDDSTEDWDGRFKSYLERRPIEEILEQAAEDDRRAREALARVRRERDEEIEALLNRSTTTG